MGLFRAKTEMVAAEKALPGRDETMPVQGRHLVLGTPLTPPFPDGFETITVGIGCFWGAERKFWQADGVYTTAVGYAGGFTPNPSYEEVCSGRTGHTEVVLAVFDPSTTSYEQMLKIFWESHNPTQGMRQGNDVGTQYRSLIAWHSDAQRRAAENSRDMFQKVLWDAGMGDITTEIEAAGPFYYAEPYHQQYLAANPNGYCGLGGTGLSCPVGIATAEQMLVADVVSTEPADCAAAYRELRARVSELVRDADPASLDGVAAATPEWRVRDILAHLSGVNTDIVNGNVSGVASNAWTDAQVVTRRDWAVEDLLAEWETNGSAVETNAALLGSAAGQWVYDACTHEHDIRQALAAPGARDSDAVAIAFEWGTDWLARGLDGQGATGLVLETDGGAKAVGAGEPRVTVRVERFELIRAMTGRRSVAQMEAYGWDGPPQPAHLVLTIFTPRAADFVE